jgi:hypothetical protein
VTISDYNVLQIITRAIASGQMGDTQVDPQGMYMLLTSADIKMPSGFCTAYCGWHTQSSYNSRALRYGVVGDASTQCPSGCHGNRYATISGDAASDNMASILAHELVETATDPAVNLWKNAAGYENADLCAWQYGATWNTPSGAKANMKLRNGKQYLIQQNWVNHNGGYCGVKI